jgi:hypothetical protein
MKQGHANSSKMAGTKVEPIPHAVSPEYTDQLGQALNYKKKEVYEGRGLKAPMVGTTTHHCGSQGKH